MMSTDVGRIVYSVWLPLVLVVPRLAVTKFLTLLLRPLFMVRSVKLLAIEFVVVDRRETRPLRQLSRPRTQGFDASNTPNI